MRANTREQFSNVLKRFFDSAHQATTELAMIALDEYEAKTNKRNQQAHAAQPAQTDRLMTVKEVAAFLVVKERTIYEWVSAGKIPFRRAGNELRFKREEVLEWTEKQEKLNHKGRMRVVK